MRVRIHAYIISLPHATRIIKFFNRKKNRNHKYEFELKELSSSELLRQYSENPKVIEYSKYSKNRNSPQLWYLEIWVETAVNT
jgi:hypothetical protein